MAAPVLETYVHDGSSSAGTSLSITNPTGLASGDVLLVIGSWSDNRSSSGRTITGATADFGQSDIDSDNDGYSGAAGYDSSGSESLQMDGEASDTDMVYAALRISGGSAADIPALQVADDSLDPPSITLDSDTDYLIVCGVVVFDDNSVSGGWTQASPSGYATAVHNNSEGTSVSKTWVSFATKQVTGQSSEDPGAFTGSISPSSGQYAAFTIAIPEGAGGGVTSSGAISTTVPTLSGSATVEATASGAITATVPTLSGSAQVEAQSSGAISAPIPTLDGTGAVTATSSGAISAPVPNLAGLGAVEAQSTGAISAPVPDISGSGTVEATSSGAITSLVPNLDGTATVGTVVTSSGAISTVVPAISGSGTVEVQSTGAIATIVPTLDGTASVAGDAQETPERSWPSFGRYRADQKRAYERRKRIEEEHDRLRRKWMAALEEAQNPKVRSRKQVVRKAKEVDGLLARLPETAETSFLARSIDDLALMMQRSMDARERRIALQRMDAMAVRIQQMIDEEDLLLLAAVA